MINGHQGMGGPHSTYSCATAEGDDQGGQFLKHHTLLWVVAQREGALLLVLLMALPTLTN